MLKNTKQIALAFLLFFASLHAQSVLVWTLDEQLPSDNITVLRFKVQNTGQQAIHGLELHYRVKQEWSEIAPAEAYYIPDGNTEWVQLGGGEAVLKISFPNAVLGPMDEFPNSSGFSVGLHTNNWGTWSKSDDYSQPVSDVFTLTDRISVYSNGIALNGGTGGETVPNNVACPNVWFLEIQTDSVKIGWLPSGNAEEQKVLELRSFSGASRTVDLLQAADSSGYMEWSGAFSVQHQNRGELWLNCSGKMAAYFAYGFTPENAEPAVEAGLWESESAFVRANASMGFNVGILPEDRFIVEAEEFGRRISDWKLYHAWEAPDLPELPKIAFPGLGVAIQPESPNDSMLFAWTAVANTYMYQLYVVRDSAYGDTLVSMFVPGTEVRLPMPPTGIYVWWAEPISIMPMGWWSSAKKAMKSVAKAVAEVVVQTTPLLPYLINNDVSVPESIIKPFFTVASPMGIINVVAGGVVVGENTLGIEPIRARKDTRMLDLSWGSKNKESIDFGWWDRPNTTSDERDDEKNRCWAVATQQMNKYFGGDLTQDEIIYHVKSPGNPIEKHFPHEDIEASGFPSIVPAMGFALSISPTVYYGFEDWLEQIGEMPYYIAEFLASAPGWFALPPDPYTVITTIAAGIPMVIIQVNQGYDKMHVMVIDGYKIEIDGSVYLHFIGTNNWGGKDAAEWRYYASIFGLGLDAHANMSMQIIANLADYRFELSFGANFYVAYYIPPPHAIGRLTDPLVNKDSDNDSIVDFDEIYRFGTDPEDPDSDKDGVPDKMEIAYYVWAGASADIDGDGLRAELDVDSDNDGDCDGDENANKNDRKDGDETDMMNPNSLDYNRRKCEIKPVALLASHQLNINDRAYCTDSSMNYCSVASIGLAGGNAVQLGASAKIGSITAGASVWLRSNASVSRDVRAWGNLIKDAESQVTGTESVNDTAAFISTQVYRPLLLLDIRVLGISETKQISPGQTLELSPGRYERSITVSSGAVLQLKPGNYIIGNLTVQSGGKIELLGSDSIVLDIAGSFQWEGSFQGSDIQEAASRLKIRVEGSQDIFLNTSFGGFIVASNAHVIVGQEDKDYAGQIYAKSITLHQGTHFRWILPGSQPTLIYASTFNRGGIYARSSN